MTNSSVTRYAWTMTGMAPCDERYGAMRYVREDDYDRIKAAHDHQYSVAGTLLREAERVGRENDRLKMEAKQACASWTQDLRNKDAQIAGAMARVDLAFNDGVEAAKMVTLEWMKSVTVGEPLGQYINRVLGPTRRSDDDVRAELAEKDKALRFAVGLLANTDAADGKYPQELYDWLIKAAQDAIAEQKERDET